MNNLNNQVQQLLSNNNLFNEQASNALKQVDLKTLATNIQNEINISKNVTPVSNNTQQNNNLKAQYEQDIQNLLDKYKKEYDYNKHINTNILDSYTASFNSLTRLNQLNDDTKNKNKNLNNELDNLIKFTNTEERNVWYKYQSIDRQKYYNKIIFPIYYIILTIWSILQLYKSSAFNKISFWIKLITLIIFPYLLIYFIKFISFLIKFINRIS